MAIHGDRDRSEPSMVSRWGASDGTQALLKALSGPSAGLESSDAYPSIPQSQQGPENGAQREPVQTATDAQVRAAQDALGCTYLPSETDSEVGPICAAADHALTRGDKPGSLAVLTWTERGCPVAVAVADAVVAADVRTPRAPRAADEEPVGGRRTWRRVVAERDAARAEAEKWHGLGRDASLREENALARAEAAEAKVAAGLKLADEWRAEAARYAEYAKGSSIPVQHRLVQRALKSNATALSAALSGGSDQPSEGDQLLKEACARYLDSHPEEKAEMDALDVARRGLSLCDDKGLIIRGPGAGEGWHCTGSAHIGSALVICSNPIHKAAFAAPISDSSAPDVSGTDDEDTWRCKRCGSKRWVSASLNRGATRIKQCIPCGHYSTDRVDAERSAEGEEGPR